MSNETQPVRVGQKVAPFTLTTYEYGKGDFGEFSLEKQMDAGKWSILFFYPADFTFVCATEFAALADHYEAFKALGAEVVTVSTDTQYVHLAWRKDEKMLQNVSYPMGADPTGAVSRLFGVYDDATGLALRGAFIVAPDGTLYNSEVNFYNLGRNIPELLRKLKANVHIAKHPEEACPASWKDEGDKTLTPNAEMVGHVWEALEG